MKRALPALRLAGAFLAAWAALAALAKLVRIAPDWPLPAAAAALAATGACLAALYRYEARVAGPRRARRLVLLRLAALALVAWILLEPTLVRTVTRAIERELVVLVDESASMQLIDDGAAASRLDIARQALAAAGLEQQLSRQLRVRRLGVARSAAPSGESRSAGWDQATDLAAALETALDQVPPEQLAGALLVTDGRHNRPSRVDDAARRFGILDAPVGVLAVGSPDPPRDAAVVNVRSPEAVHLGDRMRIDAEVKFDHCKGEQAVVRLVRGADTLDQRILAIPQDHHREELRFLHKPESGGISGFRIEIDQLANERFADNNAWAFETSITEARTHVLLVDSSPRWEFRYLRNLFYGRDKSVQLQWLLTAPEGVTGSRIPDVHASAARPFGQAEATRLPADEQEWRKFDVLILGDIPPETLTPGEWDTISRCVHQRGALLVLIAGPRFMPHALRSPAARRLVPVDPGWGPRNYYDPGSQPFAWAPTAAGRRHPATRPIADDEWAGFPPLDWRHPVAGLAEGAEVLLVAADGGADAPPPAGEDLGAALDALTRRRQREAERALLVTRQAGRGKTALLLTDRTWRLREGAGDFHHHRFWRNLVRWGAGPLLRAGTERVALGTDLLDYTADDKVVITARLRGADMTPVAAGDLHAEIRRNDAVVGTVPLPPLPDSAGLHEGVAGPFTRPGIYQVRLVGASAAALLDGGGELPAARFRVVASRGPVELADTTLNRPLLDEIAKASGGKVVGPGEVADLLPLFLGQDLRREQVRETPLWDNPWVFALLAAVLTTEWLTRRNSGLP